MSRWKAAGIHLVLTVGVIGALGFTMLSTWYAMGLFEFAHADRLLFIVAAIDITVGPLLTLLVYRKGKRGLKLDLGLIGLAQIAFLVYGLSVVWVSRPVFLVALPERIVLVFAHEIEDDLLPVTTGRLPRQRLPWFGPERVGARRPQDPIEQSKLVDALLAGRDLPLFPQHYVPYSELVPQLLAGSDGLEMAIIKLPAERKQAIATQVRRRFGEQVRTVPITSSRGNAVMLISEDKAVPLQVLPIQP